MAHGTYGNMARARRSVLAAIAILLLSVFLVACGSLPAPDPTISFEEYTGQEAATPEYRAPTIGELAAAIPTPKPLPTESPVERTYNFLGWFTYPSYQEIKPCMDRAGIPFDDLISQVHTSVDLGVLMEKILVEPAVIECFGEWVPTPWPESPHEPGE